jgi:hypothetical protein
MGGSQLTYGLFCIFGISAWVTINGIFAQLPLLAQRQPEGWALGSHLGLAVQLANVGPALYIGLRRCAPQLAPTVSGTIYTILGCSFLSMLGLVRPRTPLGQDLAASVLLRLLPVPD